MTVLPLLPDSVSLSEAALQVTKPFASLSSDIVDLVATWQGLQTAYSAPEAESVYAAWGPLTPFVDALSAVATSAQDALDTYASAVAALATRRADLVSRQNAQWTCTADETDDASDDETLDADIRQFITDAEDADQTCADALNALATRVNSALLTIPQDISNPVGDLALGTGAGLIENYRRNLLVTTPARLDPPRLSDVLGDDYFDSRPMVERPSGLFTSDDLTPGRSLILPDGRTLILPDPPSGFTRGGNGLLLPDSVTGDTSKSPGGLLLTPDDAPEGFKPAPTGSGALVPDNLDVKVVRPPSWIRVGGKVLGPAGSALGAWSAWSEEYEEDLVDHPEWTEDKRQTSAATSAAVDVAGGVGGGALGAWGGAAAGAAIGSVVPVIGTVAGGIIGGIIGGFLGGWGGSEAADAINDGVIDPAMDGN